jgi:uncharacterized membrane protein YphA (DoxX/SURF4 family)
MATAVARGRQPVPQVWHSLFRIGLGGYWLYFASQKWHGIDWMRPLIQQSAQTNPVPGLHQVLVLLVAPNWQVFALLQDVGETAVAVLLILGLATRGAGVLATLLALNVSLTVAFLEPDIGLRWTYYLAVLAGLEVAVNGGGSLALDSSPFVARFVPSWLRS